MSVRPWAVDELDSRSSVVAVEMMRIQICALIRTCFISIMLFISAWTSNWCCQCSIIFMIVQFLLNWACLPLSLPLSSHWMCLPWPLLFVHPLPGLCSHRKIAPRSPLWSVCCLRLPQRWRGESIPEDKYNMLFVKNSHINNQNWTCINFSGMPPTEQCQQIQSATSSTGLRTYFSSLSASATLGMTLHEIKHWYNLVGFVTVMASAEMTTTSTSEIAEKCFQQAVFCLCQRRQLDRDLIHLAIHL